MIEGSRSLVHFDMKDGFGLGKIPAKVAVIKTKQQYYNAVGCG
ncbi:MAG: hypothetical protein QXI32_04210 [Candidatus Bathyarchaeia archaeon]